MALNLEPWKQKLEQQSWEGSTTHIDGEQGKQTVKQSETVGKQSGNSRKQSGNSRKQSEFAKHQKKTGYREKPK